VRSLGGRIREVRLDGLVEGAYAATVEVAGPNGAELVDARSSDALNLAALTAAPIFAVLEVLEDSDRNTGGDSAEAVLMRRTLAARPVTIERAEP
jgi:bifunctional DNase/RNase